MALTRRRGLDFTRSPSKILFGFEVVGFLCSVLSFVQGLQASIISDCSELGLRSAMAEGGVVKFACDGTITLSNTLVVSKDTLLDGNGRQVTISGGGATRVFSVEAGRSLTLLNMEVSDGHADRGSAVRSIGGSLTVSNCVFRANTAIGSNEVAGGAIWLTGGSMDAFRCVFVGNQAIAVGAGEAGASGTNAPGSSGGIGWSARGGAVWTSGMTLLQECYFYGNSSTGSIGGVGGQGDTQRTGCGPCHGLSGGTGGAGGNAMGGGVFHDSGDLRVVSCTFASNSVAGGWGGRGGTGGMGAGSVGGIGGTGGVGGVATGAGINAESGIVLATNNTWFGNQAEGGAGGSGGPGGAGSGCSEVSSGGKGGNGLGGAVHTVLAAAILVHNTLAQNAAREGVGGVGGVGGGSCGQVLFPGPSGVSGDGLGGGVASGSNGLTLASTILAFNSGGNGTGSFVDAGFNISSDASLQLTNRGGWVDLDPRLLALADNGGPTPTMALDPESPAIDHCMGELGLSVDQRGVTRSYGIGRDAGAYELEQPPGPAACDAEALRTSIASGGFVVPACDGVYRLTEPLVITRDTIIDASGRDVILSGGRGTRVIHINPGVALTLIHVTLQEGRSTEGAGIYNDGGVATLVDCVVSTNRAIGLAGAKGTDAPQNHTSALGGDGGAASDGMGGGIFNSGLLRLTNSIFRGNLAQGGQGGAGGIGGNSAQVFDVYGRCRSPAAGAGGIGGMGAHGFGGAIFNQGYVMTKHSTFVANVAVGGAGGAGGAAGRYPCIPVAPARSGGAGGAGGESLGGALYNAGILEAAACVLFGNETRGANGGMGGEGSGSGLPVPGAPGPGGRGEGGALFNAGTNAFENVTVAVNVAKSGNCAAGKGGAIENVGRFGATNCTIWLNSALADPRCLSQPLGATIHSVSNAETFLVNCIVGNPAFTNNCDGPVLDGGHNICSDGSAAFSAPGSLNTVDPRLGPLADNGGRTWTMALEAGSPALDAADVAYCPAVDQRDVARPAGGGCDMGAFEGNSGLYYPRVSHTFEPSTLSIPKQSSLVLVISNISSQAWLREMTLTHRLSPELVILSTTNSTTDCSGTMHVDLSNRTYSVSGITLAPRESCRVVVDVAPANEVCGVVTNPPAVLASAYFVPPFVSTPATLVVRRPEASRHALALDGVDDWMVATKSVAFASPATVSLWFRTSTTNGGPLIGRLDALGGYVDQPVYMQNSGQIVAGIGPSPFVVPTTIWFVVSPKAYNDARWHWVVVTYSHPGLSLFLDGELVAQDPIARNYYGVISSWTVGFLPLSTWPDPPTQSYFSGEIDEVQIWGLSRSAAEIQLDYQQCLCGTDDGLSIYWRADEGKGSSLASTGTQDISAILMGNPVWTSPGSPVVGFTPIALVGSEVLKIQSILQPREVGILLTSTNLVDWQPSQTNAAAADGLITFRENFLPSPFQFYRTVGQIESQ